MHLNWAITAGKTSSTFEDGIRRPSSAEFWSEMTGLAQDSAIELVLGIAAEAGRLVRRDADVHLKALKTLVASYIAARSAPTVVDWDFITRRNMRPTDVWKSEDSIRHREALQTITATGYSLVPSDKAHIRSALIEKKVKAKKPASGRRTAKK